MLLNHLPASLSGDDVMREGLAMSALRPEADIWAGLQHVRFVPISEVASLAESRPLVEFQIASVCEKNRKVCGQRLIQSIDPGSSRHRHREQSFLRVSQGADLLSIYPHTCGPAANHTKLARGRGADINNAASTIRAAIVYPHGYRKPIAHVGH